MIVNPIKTRKRSLSKKAFEKAKKDKGKRILLEFILDSGISLSECTISVENKYADVTDFENSFSGIRRRASTGHKRLIVDFFDYRKVKK